MLQARVSYGIIILGIGYPGVPMVKECVNNQGTTSFFLKKKTLLFPCVYST